MEIVSNILTEPKIKSKVLQYRMWKQGLHKWPQYIHNRHRKDKLIDPYSQWILDQIKGFTVVYNSGGLFFKEFNSDIVVVENQSCPVNLQDVLYTDTVINDYLAHQVDSLVCVNPLSLKYHHSLADFLATDGPSRIGYKPKLIEWMAKSSRIFLSFSDYHIYYNRLKITIQDWIAIQEHELKQIGLTIAHKEILPSTWDLVNGNVRLVLEN